jgi:oxazoline/thiazoline synthase
MIPQEPPQKSRDRRDLLRFRPRYRPFGVDGEGLFLLSERDVRVLEGQIFVDLAEHLSHGAEEHAIVDALKASYQPAAIYYALHMMTEQGLLTHDVDPDTALATFWDELGYELGAVRHRLAEIQVAVTAINGADISSTIQALGEIGIESRQTDTPQGHSLHLVLTTDYLAPSLADCGALNWRERRPWLLSRTSGSQVWIGPLFRPESGCYECLSARLGSITPMQRYVTRRTGRREGVTGSCAATPLHDHLISRLVALEVAKWAVERDEHQFCCVRVIDLATLRSSEHPLQRRPQCGLCGDPTLQAQTMTRPITLTSTTAVPTTSLADLKGFISPITGIISSLAAAETGLPSVHTYTAFSCFGGDASNLEGLKNSLISHGAGVGTTDEEAQHGALCEALERYCGMTFGDEPTLSARYADLDPSTTINPTTCMLYSNRQYMMREKINAEHAAFNLVPQPFDETVLLDWSGVWSLTAGRFKMLPSSFLFYFYPLSPGPAFCWADSNGCAAGATFQDAVRRGLYELIERDSVAVWWYNRLRRPRVDIASFNDAYLDSLVEVYNGLQRDIWALDITSDLGVPTFATVSRRREGDCEDIILGFGTHLDARVALRHALCEMNHILPAVLPKNRSSDGDYPYPEASQKRWWRTASIRSEPYLVPDSDKWLGAQTYRTDVPPDDAGQIESVRTILEDAGMEILVLDQTRPDVGLPVAKVMVPGLRHFWARFAPGRLYDVPVSMGWLKQAHTENQLNPIALFL